MIPDRFRHDRRIEQITALLSRKGARAVFPGLTGAAAAFFVCAFLEEKHKKSIIIAQNELAARKYYEDLQILRDTDRSGVLLLRPLEYMLYDVEARSTENEAERVQTLYKLATGEWDVLVLSLAAACQPLPEPKYILNNAVSLHPGDRLEPGELADQLGYMGYVRVPQVDGRGQFAVRGDIFDVFPEGEDAPYRIEFFDDEIDTVRTFDLISQRTVAQAAGLRILPERETYIWDEQQALEARTDLKAELFALNPSSAAAITLRSDIEKIKPFARFSGYDRYLPYIIRKKCDIFDYCGAAAVFVSCPSEAREAAEHALDEYVRIADTVRSSSGLPDRTAGWLLDGSELLARAEQKAFAYAELELFDRAGTAGAADIVGTAWHNGSSVGTAGQDGSAVGAAGQDGSAVGAEYDTADLHCRAVEPTGDNVQKLAEYLKARAQEKWHVLLFADTEGKKKQFQQLLDDGGIGAGVELRTGGLSGSFEFPDAKLAVISEGLLFRHARARIKRKLRGQTLSSFADLKPGDYVVHDVHGIGRFAGIEALTVDGVKKDYIKITYRDNGIIFVPTHQLDSVQKYIGNDDAEPELSKLGSSEWKRATGRVKSSLRVYARELVELYAKRSQTIGYAFDPDTEWQREFEAEFPYEETDDQLRCTDEIKADMEKAIPMDRLLCGDVGYGKTEVALRAVFKAVIEGKQVAFLVPTTVLAQQHYNNFVQRFKKFPIHIDYLCRFRTNKERRDILDRLAAGKLDVLIGTHALISDKVVFRSLGLVIVDEEQRFGVKHKEKLKERYPYVDTLSLSATPIPRTLHMSLSGIRDISVLEDPPADRLPVQTYVAEWDGPMLKNAIYKELARGGQVFYLYNRVESMDAKLRELRELVPEARIVSAHGQMAEHELEKIMLEFYQGEFDVLLCTTIIESGLDMPNVNTVIVENGERMGLSQLYQLRGRVGRSSRQAYAYITYRPGRELPENAEKRLRAIRENTEFGSGFKIALRDLEIRGAGSVLGEQQHGQLAAVGYETYCRLLAEVLEEERSGREVTPKGRCSVEMNAGGFIDPAYIADEAARFEIYQKIARVEHEEDVLELTDELIDRFGTVPDNVLNLMKVARIRHYAEFIGFTSIIEKEDRVMLYAVDKESANPSLVRPDISQHDGNYLAFHAQYGHRLKISRTKAGAVVTFQPGADNPGRGRQPGSRGGNAASGGNKSAGFLDATLELMKAWVKIC